MRLAAMKKQILRLDQTSLSKKLGFNVPVKFAEFLQSAYEISGNNWEETVNWLGETIGFYPSLPYDRDPQTPPELFPIANMGVDGVHYGYVIHAPELPRSDYPMGEYCPIDSGGVFLLGENTATALENMLSWQLDYNISKEKDVLRLSRLLHLKPAPQKANRRYGPDGNGLPIRPEIPEGWQYVPSTDGIGVLAPSSAFASKTHVLPENTGRAFLENADQAIERDFLGTALFYLREGFWKFSANFDMVEEFSDRMTKVYRLLGREILACAVEEKWNNYFRPGCQH
jgi:hypothetical protein